MKQYILNLVQHPSAEIYNNWFKINLWKWLISNLNLCDVFSSFWNITTEKDSVRKVLLSSKYFFIWNTDKVSEFRILKSTLFHSSIVKRIKNFFKKYALPCVKKFLCAFLNKRKIDSETLKCSNTKLSKENANLKQTFIAKLVLNSHGINIVIKSYKWNNAIELQILK